MNLNHFTNSQRLLCLVLLAALSGCNSKESSPDKSGDGEPNNTPIAAEKSGGASTTLPKIEESEISSAHSNVEEGTNSPAISSRPPVESAAEPIKMKPTKIADSIEPRLPTSPPQGFAICSACHSMEKGGGNKLGPNLFGIVGSASAKKAGFSYSDALKNSNIIWTKGELDAYLLSPQGKVPGTKMTFGGIKDADRRAKYIEYLATFQ